MKSVIAGCIALATAGAVGVLPAVAADDDPDFIALGVGWFDVNDDMQAADFRVEYRSDRKLFSLIKPWAGVEFTSDGAVYGVAGVLVDIFFGRRLVLTPSFGVGAYAEGDGKDLGNTVEFRSQLEFGYRFDDRSRLAVSFSHISNAGLGSHNPGTEVATVYYELPAHKLFGE